MNLYIFKYNNYYNRIVKKEENIADYGEYIHLIPNCRDFTPNDHINTIHTFGSAATNYDGSGDYCVITNGEKIISRWFIIETRFLRTGQWQLNLRRDLMADYYDEIINAPCFIEKATLNYEDPLIFNQENMSFNQIKTKEWLLQDNTKCAWLVGYYAKDSGVLNGVVRSNSKNSKPTIDISIPIEEWEFYGYNSENPFYAYPTELSAQIFFNVKNAGETIKSSLDLFGGNVVNEKVTVDTKQSLYFNEFYSLSGINKTYALETAPLKAALTDVKKDTYKGLSQSILEWHSELDTNQFLSYNNIYLRDSNNRVFLVTITRSANTTLTKDVSKGSSFGVALSEYVKNVPATFADVSKNYFNETTFPNDRTFKIKMISPTYYISVVEQEEFEITYNIPDVKLTTVDEEYNIFAIPYGTVNIRDSRLQNTVLKTNKEIGMATAAAIKTQHGEKIYDIQLLPYCPIPELMAGSNIGQINIDDDLQYSYVVDNSNNTNVGIIFNVPRSTFSINIWVNFKEYLGETNIAKKVNDACDKWRICSPNFSNYFDFSLQKNNGIDRFNVDCNYKPYTPYIHINPGFGGLYGRDFDDPRGLVLGGDFSITQVIDKWADYQIQNKNFQAIFDRQIQNMEVQHNVGRTQDIASTIAGVGTGVAAGMLGGASLGMPHAAAIGGVVGGITAGVGGIMDIVLNEQLRTEAIDYSTDLFGYQLDNIKALPNTISKVSAINANNKLFPVLEYYTCTDREKNAFVDKLAYNGMTVMAIGTIADYINNYWIYGTKTSKNYIKGKIIRIENLHDDFHLIKSISEEIYKGGYF